MHSFSMTAGSVLPSQKTNKVCAFQFAFYILLKKYFTDEIDKLSALGVIFVSCDIEFDAI